MSNLNACKKLRKWFGCLLRWISIDVDVELVSIANSIIHFVHLFWLSTRTRQRLMIIWQTVFNKINRYTYIDIFIKIKLTEKNKNKKQFILQQTTTTNNRMRFSQFKWTQTVTNQNQTNSPPKRIACKFIWTCQKL